MNPDVDDPHVVALSVKIDRMKESFEELEKQVRRSTGAIIRLRACLTELWPTCDRYRCEELATVESPREGAAFSEWGRGGFRTPIVKGNWCDEHAKLVKEETKDIEMRRLRGVDELTEGNES